MNSNGTRWLFRYDNIHNSSVAYAYDYAFYIVRQAANEKNPSPVPHAAKLENFASASAPQTNVENHSIAPLANAAAVAEGPGKSFVSLVTSWSGMNY
ncbi:hypothetical protein MRB53_030854 [Persea americana]|uniref:Uncharacterized protein n=1 Tax=Persea americana TaxID=3435 RepID=A0ACC2KN05_PERAE|nr:hypothetical protein MRB53_030854 [Persea americana]